MICFVLALNDMMFRWPSLRHTAVCVVVLHRVLHFVSNHCTGLKLCHAVHSHLYSVLGHAARCAVLCCAVLCCAVLCCAVLSCAMLC